MSDIYLWAVTGVAAFVAASTLFALVKEPAKIFAEQLSDLDRAFVWRTVVFIVFPLFNFLALRATIVATELLGGTMKSWSFGVLWFDAHPVGITSAINLAVAYLAGPAVQILLAMIFLCALVFRPHPFLATLICYSASFILGLNLIADPIFSCFGLGGVPWEAAYVLLPVPYKAYLLTFNIVSGLSIIFALGNESLRLLFLRLTRPLAFADLQIAQAQLKSFPHSGTLQAKLCLAYEQAGLLGRAQKTLKQMRKDNPRSLYAPMLEGLLAYRRRDYKVAYKVFLLSAELPGTQGRLKSYLLSAAACSAFAQNDKTQALNLAERALEFDDQALVARMVKVDVFLGQGKKDQAAHEILQSIGKGLNLELRDKVPLDVERTISEIAKIEDLQKERAGQSQPISRTI